MPLSRWRLGGARTFEAVKTEEKGSGVNLASFLLLDAFQGDREVAVEISNDSDLKLPIEVARNELEIEVGIINPHRVVDGDRHRAVVEPFEQLVGLRGRH